MRVSKPWQQPNLYLPFLALACVATQTQRSNRPHSRGGGSPGLQPPSDPRAISGEGNPGSARGGSRGAPRGADPGQGTGVAGVHTRYPAPVPRTLHSCGSPARSSRMPNHREGQRGHRQTGATQGGCAEVPGAAVHSAAVRAPPRPVAAARRKGCGLQGSGYSSSARASALLPDRYRDPITRSCSDSGLQPKLQGNASLPQQRLNPVLSCSCYS